MTSSTASLLLALFALDLQVVKMEPDSPKFMNNGPKSSSDKVFAVDSYEKGPIGVVEVEEVKQQNPPSLWAVTVRNRDTAAISAYRLTAVVVTGDHKIKGTQQLPAMKDLQPGKERRQQIKIFPTILNPTDRVVFYVSEVTANGAPWKVDVSAASELVRKMAARYPLQ